MRQKIYMNLTVLGMVVLLGGLLCYAFAWHEALPLPRPDLFPWATSIVGILCIVCGACEFAVKKDKQQQIEEMDERNCMIANRAKASAYEVMTVLFSILLLGMALLGYLSTAAFFCFAAVFITSQLVFILRLWYLQKTM